MKEKLLLLLMLFIISPATIFANDDDDVNNPPKEYIDIVDDEIPLSLDETTAPITAWLYYTNNIMEVTFLEDLGNVTISISKNGTTMEEHTLLTRVSQPEYFNLNCHGSGNYIIRIVTSSGKGYVGQFAILE